MKKSMIFVGMLAIGFASAQDYSGNVGINTDTPSATLEIKVADVNTNNNTNQGILIPKLTKNRIAQIAQTKLVEGTLVYATDTTYAGTNTKVSKITEKGYYYYNGTEWVKVQYKDSEVDTSLYSNDGTLSNNRTVNTNGKNLLFTGTGKIGISTDNPGQKLEVVGNILANGGLMSNTYHPEGGYIQLTNSTKKEGLAVNRWTIYNMNKNYVPGLHFWAYAADGTNLSSQMVITDAGNVGIGFNSSLSHTTQTNEKLEVNGKIRITSQTGVAENGSCTNKGTIAFGSDGNFYGCIGTGTGAGTWKKLNN